MKSIRLSLMVYFLGLLALALGVASWLVYEIARETLQDKQRAAKSLVETQYKERCDEEKKRRDDQLLLEAQTLNKLVQFDRYIRGRELNQLNWTGLAIGVGTRGGLENLLSAASIGGWPRDWPAWVSVRATRWGSWIGIAAGTWSVTSPCPMMGAVLHTLNVRLSPEQILYTINHAEDDVILVNVELLAS